MYTLKTELEEVMKDKQMTHIGAFTDIGIHQLGQVETFLRETKMYYISEDGVKFRKVDGIQTGSYPTRKLLLDTVEKI